MRERLVTVLLATCLAKNGTSLRLVRMGTYGFGLMAGQSARQQAGLGLTPSLATDTTRATPRRTTSGTKTSGYVAMAAKAMSVPGTTTAIAAVGCRSVRSASLASAASATPTHGCRSGHLPNERRVSRPQPQQFVRSPAHDVTASGIPPQHRDSRQVALAVARRTQRDLSVRPPQGYRGHKLKQSELGTGPSEEVLR